MATFKFKVGDKVKWSGKNHWQPFDIYSALSREISVGTILTPPSAQASGSSYLVLVEWKIGGDGDTGIRIAWNYDIRDLLLQSVIHSEDHLKDKDVL